MSASAAVKVSAIQNAENVAGKVVKMLKTNAKKIALLKSCIEEDVSSQGETKRYLVGLCETRFVEGRISIPVMHSKFGAKNCNKVCPKSVQNALKWLLQYLNFQKFSGAPYAPGPPKVVFFSICFKFTLSKKHTLIS